MVRVGSARSNENGGINGGKPGDQKGGREVSTQDWYLHSKGWVVIRAKDRQVRELIAHNMESICANNNIGYCQDHRTSLIAIAAGYGYDASKILSPCETDCSEAVRVCCLYAGVKVASFNTANEVSTLRATGKFDILKDDKYCKKPDYLLRGDILVTRTKGHTVVILDDGAKAAPPEPANIYAAIKEISRRAEEDQITVVGNGSPCVVGGHAYEMKKGQRFISNSAIASMGYDLPAAIGACLADHTKDIILVTGDGSIQMNLQELQTIIHNHLRLSFHPPDPEDPLP